MMILFIFQEKAAYPNESQTIRAQKACVATIPKVLIIGRKEAIARDIKTDLRPLIKKDRQGLNFCKKKKRYRTYLLPSFLRFENASHRQGMQHKDQTPFLPF